MSLPQKSTPVLHLNQHSIYDLKNFKCKIHPQIQIQALRFDKCNKNFTLMCIKCIIEVPETEGEDEFIPINDLLDSYSNSLSATLQEKFAIKDYMDTYERHLESLYSKVDQEIVEIIGMLIRLRDKYKQYYHLELNPVRELTVQMKSKTNRLLENTKDQVYAQMDKITNHDELLNFLRDLYHKSKEQNDEESYVDDDCRKLLANLESFKEKALTCTIKEAQISALEDIKDSLQSLLQPESSAFRKSVEGIKASIPNRNENETEIELKTEMKSRIESRREEEYKGLEVDEYDNSERIDVLQIERIKREKM